MDRQGWMDRCSLESRPEDRHDDIPAHVCLVSIPVSSQDLTQGGIERLGGSWGRDLCVCMDWLEKATWKHDEVIPNTNLAIDQLLWRILFAIEGLIDSRARNQQAPFQGYSQEEPLCVEV